MVTLFAHVRCTQPETVTTFLVCASAAALLLRPWRQTTRSRARQRSLVTVVFAVIFTAAGCGGGDSTTNAVRPATTARIRILTPTPNQVSPSDVVVRVELIGGRVVERTSGELTPGEGHLRVSLDGEVVSTTFEEEQVLRRVAPGPHALEVEFVAVDQGQFANRPRSVVLFEVE